MYQVSFLDYDIVGTRHLNFVDLLNKLIKLKGDYPDFTIRLAEIVTKDLSYTIIKKMVLAGFRQVQIGYESPSANLLSKIDKKNTFASNLFFIKWATCFNIKVKGANILRNLLEETEEDIKESIANLNYLRFILPTNSMRHQLSYLAVSETSPYYKELNSGGKLEEWSSLMDRLVTGSYIAKEDRPVLFFDYVKRTHHPLWDTFEKAENHYVNNRYKYTLLYNDGIVFYKEYYNDKLIKDIEFSIVEVDWRILEQTNKRILSEQQLIYKFSSEGISEEAIKAGIQELRREGILYVSPDHTEIFTVLNTDLAEIERDSRIVLLEKEELHY